MGLLLLCAELYGTKVDIDELLEEYVSEKGLKLWLLIRTRSLYFF